MRPEDRDRFPNNDLTQEPRAYRMRVHLFGATSSPGCANYALWWLAEKCREDYGNEAADFILKYFYVDDGTGSVCTIDDAIQLMKDSRELCRQGGFNLIKFSSNRREVVEATPEEARLPSLKQIDLNASKLPSEHTLGVLVDTEEDCFIFICEGRTLKISRRKLLSVVCSIFDPLGLISPYVLKGRMILQEICKSGKGWDEKLEESIISKWDEWTDQMKDLEQIKIRRCYKEEGMGKIIRKELHNFSDASLTGYGQCSYLRLIDEHGNISVNLVMAKARVAPVKPVTVPRLELVAATVSTRMSVFLNKELDMTDLEHFFWCDSRVVLGYIQNVGKKLHMFALNRANEIRELTRIDRWFHVDTRENPADLTSRGLAAEELVDNKLFYSGPDCLSDINFEPKEERFEIPENDPEVRKATSNKTSSKEVCYSEIFRRMCKFSDWRKLQHAIAVLQRSMRRFRRRKDQRTERSSSKDTVSLEDLEQAREFVLKVAQLQNFSKEYRELIRRKTSQDDEEEERTSVLNTGPTARR